MEPAGRGLMHAPCQLLAATVPVMPHCPGHPVPCVIVTCEFEEAELDATTGGRVHFASAAFVVAYHTLHAKR